MPGPTLRERLRAQLADLKMPGALEALDEILRRADSGELAAGEAIAAVLGVTSRSAISAGSRRPCGPRGSPR